ncbi:MAG: leucyl/phenylalanyl-tRNA--protein transferase [Gammaproteobacteria bacterium]|nr:leucyl/phenylalanyl-tRNA--protein transferase [Gammaproteobacteria bacterium]
MSSNRVVWLTTDDAPESFPAVETALREPDGLLAAGGDLSPERLLAAYRQGIFPWYDEGQPLLWWSPDPRCVFRKGDLHASRRLLRELRHSVAQVTFNTAFGKVIRACAGPRRYEQGTWITNDMIDAYERLHQDGWAHSVEVWQDEELIGGLYGLIIGRAVFGESMFSKHSNASKIALMTLDRMLADGSLGVIDCQVQSSHLLSLGASVIPRADFTAMLDDLCDPKVAFENWPTGPIKASELVPN